MPERSVAVRIAVKDVEEARRRLRSLGDDGQQALQKLEGGAAPATKALGGLDTSLDGVTNRLRSTASSIAVVDGPLGGIASRFNALATTLVRIGPAGLAASAAFAAVGIALKSGTAAARELETQMLTLEGVLRATGFSAGRTSEQIDSLARSIGEGTLASTREVRQAAAQLLTFRSIAGDTFDRTLRAAQDLAAVGFGSITSAAVQLGKALEDPETGLAALRRVGVSFTQSQRDLVKSLIDSGQALEAQQVVLEAVERQVGGAGEAQAGGLSGAVDTLSERWVQLLENIGNAGPIQAATEAFRQLADILGLVNDTLFTSTEEKSRQALQALREFDSQIERMASSSWFHLFSGLGGPSAEERRPERADLLQEIHLIRARGQASQFAAEGAEAAAAAAQREAAAEREAAKAKEEATKAANKARTAAERLAQARATTLSSLVVEVDQLERLAAATKDSDDAARQMQATIEVENELRKISLDIGTEEARQYEDLIRARQRLKAEIEETTEARKKEAAEAKKAADAAEREARRIRERAERERERLAKQAEELALEPLKNAFRSFQNTLTDFYDNVLAGRVSKFGDAMVAVARRFIAEMLTLETFRAFGIGGGVSPLSMLMQGGSVAAAMPGATGAGGGAFQMGALSTGLAGGFASITNAINQFGGRLGFGVPAAPGVVTLASAGPGAVGPHVLGSVPGSGSAAAQAGIFGGATLSQTLGAGALGALGGNIFGNLVGFNSAGRTGSTVGGGLGAGGGMALASLLGVTGPVGALAGGLGGSLLGGLIGNLFGGKPSDKSQVAQVSFTRETIAAWGQEGKKFSQENRDAADTFAQAALDLSRMLESLTGGTATGGLQIQVGSRDGLRLFQGNELVTNAGQDVEAFKRAITEAVASSIRGASAVQQQVLSRADMSSPEALLRDLEFGREFERLTGTSTVLGEQIAALRARFDEVRAAAVRLGLNVNKLTEAQKKAELEIRDGLMANLRQLAGEITPIRGSFQALREEFRAVKAEIGNIRGLNRGEINRLQKQAEANFREGVLAPLRELANVNASGFVAAVEQIKSLANSLRAEVGTGIGLRRGEIDRLEQRALSQVSKAFLDQLRELAGVSVGFEAELAALVDRFRQAREEARLLGVNLGKVSALEAQAIENLQQRTLSSLESQLTQQANQIRAHFESILTPLRNFRTSLDFGPLSAQSPAEQLRLSQEEFRRLAAAAANDNQLAIQSLPAAAQAFIEQSRQFGASALHAEAAAEVARVFDQLISRQEDREREVTAGIPDAIMNAADMQVQAWQDGVNRLVFEMQSVRRAIEEARLGRVA